MTNAMTLANLRAQARLTLASTDDWPNATLDAWLQEAVRAYSAELPRALRYTLALTTGTQSYALPADLQAVTGVEYPAGETPPEMVFQVSEHSARFQSGGPFYALRGTSDAAALTAAPHLAEIVFSDTVATGESAVIAYDGLHAVPYADAEYTSVPRAHTSALLAYVRFRAAVEREMDASWRECIANDKLAQLAQPARAAWEQWRATLDALRAAARQGGVGWVSWGDFGL